MTEAQWNNYVDQIVGAWVTNWTGWIDDINEKTLGGYELWIDMDPPDEMLSVYDVTFYISDEVALQIIKDTPITFSGKITAVTDILGVGLVITLEEAEWATE